MGCGVVLRAAGSALACVASPTAREAEACRVRNRTSKRPGMGCGPGAWRRDSRRRGEKSRTGGSPSLPSWVGLALPRGPICSASPAQRSPRVGKQSPTSSGAPSGTIPHTDSTTRPIWSLNRSGGLSLRPGARHGTTQSCGGEGYWARVEPRPSRARALPVRHVRRVAGRRDPGSRPAARPGNEKTRCRATS